MSEKEYGLILPNKKKEQKCATRTMNPLLNSDDELEQDDDDDGTTLNWIEASFKNSSGNSGQKSLQKRLLKEAYEEDASIFQYDEIYDDMKTSQRKEVQKNRQLIQRKPKYIETILKHTEKRKIENERRQERKVQREREEEGDEFADKESFVTPSYLKKLEELKESEAEEIREKLKEEHTDIHKHKNFGVFYNHLFKQRLGDPEIKLERPEMPEKENGSSSGTSPVVSFKKSKHKINYRTRYDLMSDEDNSPKRGVVKKEVESCGSSDSDNNCPEMMDCRLQNRRTDSCSSVEDGKEHPGRHKGGLNYSKKERGEASTSKEYIEHSCHRSKRDRHGVRGTRADISRSKDNGRRESCKRESSIDKTDQNGKHSLSRDKKAGYKDSSTDEGEQELFKNKRIVNEEGETNTINGKSGAKRKQSINTALGVTDVNKMKIEGRIKRFRQIFAKKNVGQTLEESVQRYFERKAKRDANGLL